MFKPNPEKQELAQRLGNQRGSAKVKEVGILNPRHVLFQLEHTMKGGQNLRDLQEKKKEENSIPLVNCMVCNKTIQGYYARYGDSGVCGRACMKHQETMERFPGHSAEDFERTMK